MKDLSHIVYYTNIGTRRCPVKVIDKKKTELTRALLCLLHFFPTKFVLGLKSGELLFDHRGLRVRLEKKKLFWLPEEAFVYVEYLFRHFPGTVWFKDFDKDSARYLSKKWLGCNPKELKKQNIYI